MYLRNPARDHLSQPRQGRLSGTPLLGTTSDRLKHLCQPFRGFRRQYSFDHPLSVVARQIRHEVLELGELRPSLQLCGCTGYSGRLIRIPQSRQPSGFDERTKECHLSDQVPTGAAGYAYSRACPLMASQGPERALRS